MDILEAGHEGGLEERLSKGREGLPAKEQAGQGPVEPVDPRKLSLRPDERLGLIRWMRVEPSSLGVPGVWQVRRETNRVAAATGLERGHKTSGKHHRQGQQASGAAMGLEMEGPGVTGSPGSEGCQLPSPRAPRPMNQQPVRPRRSPAWVENPHLQCGHEEEALPGPVETASTSASVSAHGFHLG